MTAYTLAANATLRDVGNAGIWGVATARSGHRSFGCWHGESGDSHLQRGSARRRRDLSGAGLCERVGNMRAEPTRASYSSFKMVDTKTGDDLFDATCAAVYALLTRGLADAPAVIQQRKVSRESLLDGERVLEMAAH